MSFRRIYTIPSQFTSACIYACQLDPLVLCTTYKYGQWTSHMPMTPYKINKTHSKRSVYKIMATKMACLNLAELNNYNWTTFGSFTYIVALIKIYHRNTDIYHIIPIKWYKCLIQIHWSHIWSYFSPDRISKKDARDIEFMKKAILKDWRKEIVCVPLQSAYISRAWVIPRVC